MTPEQEQAHVNILNVFAEHFEGSRELGITDLISDLRDHRADLVTMNKCYSDENDTRSGEETYGYDDVRTTITHISDRWACQFRTRCLIDLVDS